MSIFEYIIVFMFSIGILLGGFGLLYWIVIHPICEYKLRKKSNKLQWKFVEFNNSKVSSEKGYRGNLYYRILSSELPKFVKIFGDNDWIWWEEVKFDSKEYFIEFAHKYDTLGKLKTKDYWIEP